MKIAVPIHDGRFCEHFGGADAFALYTVEDGQPDIGDPLVGVPPEHGRGVFPVWLGQQGADVVLAGGMGPRAVQIFARQGVEVVLGVQGGDPTQLVREFIAGNLETTGQVCHDHGFHDCGHDNGAHGDGGCHRG